MTKFKHSKKSLSKEEMLVRYQRGDWHLDQKTYDDFSRRAMKGLKYHDSAEALPDTFRRLEQKMGLVASRPSTRTLYLKPALAVAASVALLVMAGLFLWQPKDANERLFSAHFDYLPSAIRGEVGDTDVRNTPTSGSSDKTLKEQALAAYGNKQYAEALVLMERYHSSYPEDTEMAFYQAILYLGQGQERQALTMLEGMADQLPRQEYQRAFDHYLALAYLKTGHMENAKALFRQLSAGKDRYARKAADILKKWPAK